MYNVYNNGFLKHINIENIKSKLLAYIIKDDELSYEFSGKHRDFIIITGYNQEEKELPMFDHPILINGMMNKNYIAVDLRKYVKSNIKEKPLTIKNELSNFSYGMFILNRLVLTDMYLDDKSKLNILQEPIGTVFSYVISTYIETMIGLTPKEKVQIEAISYLYVINMFLENYNKEEKKTYFKAKLKSAKLSFPLLNDNIDEILSCNLDANRFELLFENIGYLLGTKKQAVNIKGFVNSISNLWYGPGMVETTLLSLDDLPTMISLYYAGLTDNNLKKNKISLIIDKYKKKLDLDKINKLTMNIKSYSL